MQENSPVQRLHEEIDRMMRSPELSLHPLSELKQLWPAHHHDETAVQNVNEIHAETLGVGQRVADAVARNMGSWRFIIIQSCLLVAWVALNILAFIHHWDPYPFILLNLALSFQAAYSAPIIMMSQNRQSDKDRLEAHNDYQINLRAEQEVTNILRHLDYQDALILQILGRLERAATQDGAAQPDMT